VRRLHCLARRTHLYTAVWTRPLLKCHCRSIESWQLSQIKRDDYAPNTPGMRQWEMDRKKWLANRLLSVVKVRRNHGGPCVCCSVSFYG
jgi:hypothetical protein